MEEGQIPKDVKKYGPIVRWIVPSAVVLGAIPSAVVLGAIAVIVATKNDSDTQKGTAQPTAKTAVVEKLEEKQLPIEDTILAEEGRVMGDNLKELEKTLERLKTDFYSLIAKDSKLRIENEAYTKVKSEIKNMGKEYSLLEERIDGWTKQKGGQYSKAEQERIKERLYALAGTAKIATSKAEKEEPKLGYKDRWQSIKNYFSSMFAKGEQKAVSQRGVETSQLKQQGATIPPKPAGESRLQTILSREQFGRDVVTITEIQEGGRTYCKRETITGSGSKITSYSADCRKPEQNPPFRIVYDLGSQNQ